jgi:hypothetical protein
MLHLNSSHLALQLAFALELAHELGKRKELCSSGGAAALQLPSSAAAASPPPPSSSLIVMEPLLSANDRVLLLSLVPPAVLVPTDDGEMRQSAARISCGASTSGPCIVYMPHCPRALYSNVVLSHWNRTAVRHSSAAASPIAGTPLSSLVIVGNSFAEYHMRPPAPPDLDRCCITRIMSEPRRLDNNFTLPKCLMFGWYLPVLQMSQVA